MTETVQIKEALDRAIKTVTLKPERGQRTYRNLATVTSGTLCRAEENGRELVMDMGKALGGADAGPNPSMVLRSALSGCVAIGIRQWAAQRNVEIGKVEVALETDIDARGQLGVRSDIVPGFEKIRLEISVTSGAPRELIEDVIASSLTYSPLMDVFQSPHRIEPRVSIRSPETV